MSKNDQKMKILQQDIAKLVKYATSNGMNKEKIAELAEVAFSEYKKQHPSTYKTKILVLSALFSVVTAIFLSYNAFWEYCFVLARLFIIQLFPIWDLTFLSEHCLIKNPLFESTRNHSSVDCNVCADEHMIGKGVHVDSEVIDNAIFTNKLPFIVEEGASDWRAFSTFDLDFLFQLFTSNKALLSSAPCNMHASFDGDTTTNFSNVPSLLNAAKVNINDKDSVWFAYWENCRVEANRVLRQFYKWPTFISASVETAPFNWIVISSNHHHPSFIELNPGPNVAWYAQLKGTAKVQLRHDSCGNTCKNLYALLTPGDIVVWPNDFWSFSYKPQQHISPISLAILYGGFID